MHRLSSFFVVCIRIARIDKIFQDEPPLALGWKGRLMHGEGQALALRVVGGFLSHRSAGACPPRSLYRNETARNPEARTVSVAINAWRRQVLPRPTCRGRRALKACLPTGNLAYFRISIFRVAEKSLAVSV